jgi:hypothetical protein
MCFLLGGCSAPQVSHADAEEYIDAGHVRFYFPAGKPACAGTPMFLDDMLVRIADYLNLMPPDRVEYHYHPSADLSDACGAELSYAGCSFPGQAVVWSRDATSIHELVHAVASQDGEHYSFLAEGLATALGEENVWPTSYDVEESTYLTPETVSPAENGGIAGDLVSYLLIELGAARFMDLYRRVSPHATSQQFKDDFKAIYELDFDEVLSERRATTLRFSQNRLPFRSARYPSSIGRVTDGCRRPTSIAPLRALDRRRASRRCRVLRGLVRTSKSPSRQRSRSHFPGALAAPSSITVTCRKRAGRSRLSGSRCWAKPSVSTR